MLDAAGIDGESGGAVPGMADADLRFLCLACTGAGKDFTGYGEG